MFEGVFEGLSYLGGASFWLAFLAGLAMAAISGVLPGISSGFLMALAVPFVVFTVNDPVIGIVLLATITGVEEMLDVLPIIVLGHPGGGQVTFIEGSPLARQGYAARVLGYIYVVSALGGLVGAIALLLVIPVIKPFILEFSFPEIAAMGLFGVAMVGALSRGAMLKGIASGLVGLLLSTIGLSVFTGDERFTLGLFELRTGLPLIATTIGLFALPEMLDLTMTRAPISKDARNISTREVFRGGGMALRMWPIVLRHSIFGVFLGAIPGVGARVVSWLSYGLGISLSKDRSQFGKGSYEGLAFSESVQSSKEGGQAIPTLALGLPGGQSWVFVLVAMLAYGISPGPQMLTEYADIVTLIVVTLVLGNAGLGMIGMLWSGQMAKLTRVPYPLLASVIIPIVFLAAYQESRQWTAIPIVLTFAVVGLLMKQFRWPRPPLILGFILGGIIEKNLLSSISLYGAIGTISRPVTIILFILAIVIAVFFTKLAASSDEEGDTPPAPEGPRGWMWTWENLFPIFLIIVASAFFITSFDYLPKAQEFPAFLSLAIIAIAVAQAIRQSRGVVSGEVLDLGMRSEGVEGRKRTALILLGLIVAFLFLAAAIGLQYSAIIMAFVAPALLMTGSRPWAWGALTGVLVSAMVFGVFDRLMHILWPEPVLWAWVRDMFVAAS